VLLLDRLPEDGWSTGVTIAVTVAASLVCAAVHELTHGAVLRLLCDERSTMAVRFPYLVTGCTAHLGRRSFAAVTVLNFAGSSGDYVQACATARLPPGG
jgi:hypothetical protein